MLAIGVFSYRVVFGDETNARDRPSRYGDENFLARSAGACPPRLFALRENCTPAKAPRPRYGEGQVFPPRYGDESFLARSAGACPPRSLDLRENRTPATAVSLPEAWRGTGPRPTVPVGR